jgi:hypothetical protein
MIWKYAIKINMRGGADSMMRPPEREEKEEFWELAEEIGMTESHTTDSAFFHGFFSKDSEGAGKK